MQNVQWRKVYDKRDFIWEGPKCSVTESFIFHYMYNMHNKSDFRLYVLMRFRRTYIEFNAEPHRTTCVRVCVCSIHFLRTVLLTHFRSSAQVSYLNFSFSLCLFLSVSFSLTIFSLLFIMLSFLRLRRKSDRLVLVHFVFHRCFGSNMSSKRKELTQDDKHVQHTWNAM